MGRRRVPDGLEGGLLDAYLASIPIIVLNVIWFLVSLPLVTIFPALAALFYATNRLAHGKPADWRVFFEGFRAHFWLSWRWGLVNLLVLAVLLSNIWFYGQMSGGWVIWARGFFLALILFWLSLQMYALPLLLEQEKPNLLQALRNSLVIFIRRPLFTLWQVIVIGVIVALSTFVIGPAWAFVSASVIAYLANRSTIDSIQKLTQKAAGE